MKIGALQSDIVWEDPAANFEHLETWIAAAAAQGVELLAMPEMYACGFSMNTERIAEPVDGPSTRFLVDQAAEHGLALAGSVPELAPGATKPRNTLILAEPDGTVHRYHKIHPFSFAGEDRHYTAGRDFVTVTLGGVRITLFICYDLRFADEFWATAEDTDVYLVVANWPEPRRHHWIQLLMARAIENQAYVVGVNRVGAGGKLHYTGDSRIIDSRGETLAAAAGQEALLTADLDAEAVATTRRDLPFLRDRR